MTEEENFEEDTDEGGSFYYSDPEDAPPFFRRFEVEADLDTLMLESGNKAVAVLEDLIDLITCLGGENANQYSHVKCFFLLQESLVGKGGLVSVAIGEITIWIAQILGNLKSRSKPYSHFDGEKHDLQRIVGLLHMIAVDIFGQVTRKKIGETINQIFCSAATEPPRCPFISGSILWNSYAVVFSP